MPKKVMMWANRNGYFYVLDRTSGECLVAKPYVRVNWSSGLDENCRPIITPQPDGMPTYPGNQGGQTGTRLPSVHVLASFISVPGRITQRFIAQKSRNIPRAGLLGGGFSVLAPAPDAPTIGIGRTNPVNNWTDEVGHASLKAMDPNTGEEVWEFEQYDVSDSGMLTTVTDLLITGGREGYFPCSTQKVANCSITRIWVGRSSWHR